jgi:hypothetical protein
MTPASNTAPLWLVLLLGLCATSEDAAATSSRGVLAPAGIATAPAPDLSPGTSEVPGPLDPERQAMLRRTSGDPPPEVLAGVTEARVGQHYVTGNEHGLDAFHERVRGLGGGYLGVGAEQGYLLLGWSRAEVGWLIDYDPVVVEMHALHHAIFLAADTPARYLELWHKVHRNEAIAVLRAAYPGAAGEARLELYRRHRARVARRLDELAAHMLAAGVPSYLTDADEYAHVRALIAGGRLRTITADLTRRGAVRRIAGVARRLGVTLRVVYLSNAEEYWERLPDEFRDNLAALPADGRSVVLRTLLTWEHNRDYRYNAQPLHNYRRWLARSEVRTIHDVTHRDRVFTDARGFFEVQELPDLAALRRRELRRLRAEAGSATAP